jgi:hypothetical protein
MAPGTGNDTTRQGAPNMSSNRLRLLLVSVMAVFAISAVASASASAAATCYPVAVAGTGNYASSLKCEKKEVSTPAEWIMIEKLETEIKPGEWCAKVKVGEPSRFSDNKCTVAKVGTGEYTKVLVSLDEWEVQKCEAVAGGIFTNGTCEVVGAGGFGEAGALEKLAAGKKRSVTSAGTAFTLTAAGKAVNCTAVTDKGTITGGKPGTDLATTITFTGCTANAGACTAESGAVKGTITVTEIPTKLEQRVVGEEEVLVDNFEQNVSKKEFVTLKFDKAKAECPGFPETKVKGSVAAEVKNLANEKEIELVFPKTPVEKDTLEAFGVKATLEGTVTEKLTGGGKLKGV